MVYKNIITECYYKSSIKITKYNLFKIISYNFAKVQNIKASVVQSTKRLLMPREGNIGFSVFFPI